MIYQREGFTGFYRGYTASLIKNSLNSGTYFCVLYNSKVALESTTKLNENQVNSVASVFARIVQSTICNPIILIKTRLEVLGFSEYSSLTQAVSKVYRQEGFLGFFTGLKVSLIRDVPFSGVYYPIYEQSKDFFNKFFTPSTSSLLIVSCLSSSTANLMSCLLTHPLDIIRTRILFQQYN